VLQLIALKGEMELEFIGNGKKQGMNFLPYFLFFTKNFRLRIGANWGLKAFAFDAPLGPPFPPLHIEMEYCHWGLRPRLHHHNGETLPNMDKTSTYFLPVMNATFFFYIHIT